VGSIISQEGEVKVEVQVEEGKPSTRT